MVNIYSPKNKGNLKVYDINSLYPYTMLKNMPIGMPERITYVEPLKPDKNLNNLYGMVKAKVTVPTDLKWPFLMYRTENTNIQPVGTWTGWFTTEELKYAEEQNLAVVNEIYVAYHFTNKHPIFKNYVEKFYQLKAEGGELKLIYKLLLNSLYGIIGIKQEDEKLVIVKKDKHNIEDYVNYTFVTETNKLIYFTTNQREILKSDNNNVVEKELENSFSNVIISSFISSLSRIYIDSLIRKLRTLGIDTVYSDTDSIICNKEIPTELISSKIGDFKDEYPNKEIIEATFIAPKAYEIKFKDGTNIIKFKGVKTELLTSEDIEKLHLGEEIEINFNKFKTSKFSGVTQNKHYFKFTRNNTKFNMYWKLI